MKTDNSHLGSSHEVKSKSSNGCQETFRVGRNFMVTSGRPLFLTRERYSENSIFWGGKSVKILYRNSNSLKHMNKVEQRISVKRMCLLISEAR